MFGMTVNTGLKFTRSLYFSTGTENPIEPVAIVGIKSLHFLHGDNAGNFGGASISVEFLDCSRFMGKGILFSRKSVNAGFIDIFFGKKAWVSKGFFSLFGDLIIGLIGLKDLVQLSLLFSRDTQ